MRAPDTVWVYENRNAEDQRQHSRAPALWDQTPQHAALHTASALPVNSHYSSHCISIQRIIVPVSGLSRRRDYTMMGFFPFPPHYACWFLISFSHCFFLPLVLSLQSTCFKTRPHLMTAGKVHKHKHLTSFLHRGFNVWKKKATHTHTHTQAAACWDDTSREEARQRGSKSNASEREGVGEAGSPSWWLAAPNSADPITRDKLASVFTQTAK